MICNNCPRRCNIDRDKIAGYCGQRKLKIAKIMTHYWEEPIICDENGSGAIFFSNCSLRCCYCQNYQISHLGCGKECSVQDLANFIKKLNQLGKK